MNTIESENIELPSPAKIPPTSFLSSPASISTMSNKVPEILQHDFQNEVTNTNHEDIEQGSFETRKESEEDFSKTAGDAKRIPDTMNTSESENIKLSSPPKIPLSSFVSSPTSIASLPGKGPDHEGHEVVRASRKDEEQGFIVATIEDGFSKTASFTNTDAYSEDAMPVKEGLTLTERDDLAIASLILGMERTLFAALNNAWLLAIGGVGLMSVGHGDDRATNGGIVILSIGAVCAGVAYVMHIWRVSQIRASKSFQFSHTIIWATLIAALTIVTLGLELYFGVLYPYLSREKTVTIANDIPEGLL
eukprot:CAMPEP_0194304194 /NCGR_PEP_ID=MMETSP0171-20130528/1981_1 /TAXON_ID=218684 /ORGANISM="Corethron pennatum, Strain L29A3" /LENGTH=305 /DNA_ID=CAMNT_0039055383 /DNA_START=54 /DNA_END=971 /DNA_ORIENTATION=+